LKKKKRFYLLSKVILAVSKVRHLPPLRYGHAGPPVSSTNKTDSHDITEILLKVALNTINQSINQSIKKTTHYHADGFDQCF